MPKVDFIAPLHNATRRDYLARVNDREFPKAKAAELAKKWGYDYWDGDRRICYGGYRFIPGRWEPVARALVNHYQLKPGSRVLDVGCGKGFQLAELQKVVPGLLVHGLDVSEYALANSHDEVRNSLVLGSASELPYPDGYFDFVFSINTIHNLKIYDVFGALREIERVGRAKNYVCVESYETETQKANLLYWQVTCEAFNSPDEWEWIFKQAGYKSDFEFIFFD